MADCSKKIITYLASPTTRPLFLVGEAREVLRQMPADSVDCCITSPPYWKKRSYEQGGLGTEPSLPEYMANLLAIIAEVKRVIKPTGSLWLNLGDTYHNKLLLGVPWRVALQLVDGQGWILRNSIIWHKHKGGLESVNDRLRNVHENVFYFVKTAQGYYYNDQAIRNNPRQTIVKNGAVISATGVRGVSYKRKLELATTLTNEEKAAALTALDDVLKRVAQSEITDFRMIIRNYQRTTHSNSIQVSGRAKELQAKGFYFLFYNSKGTLPGDVWDILPEDTQGREAHYAPFPEDLCRVPLLATCPPQGLVLDPFCGTGTTNKMAYELHRKSIGIDLSETYLTLAENRNQQLKLTLGQHE